MPDDFKVIALMSAFNEADIIGQVLTHLASQAIHAYVLDNGSTDGTIDVMRPFVDRGVVTVERFVPGGTEGAFPWERILARKEELARSLSANWFIHHDADECRDSPWPNTTLLEAIQTVDRLGFNAIDFEVFNFQPTNDDFRAGDDLSTAFRYFEPAAAHDRLQIKCWKNEQQQVDLRVLGGHEASFDNRRVFPIRFILRHYPIRGQQHGEQKVFRERRNRFIPAERDRGWHLQYDSYEHVMSFIRDPCTLTPYDGDLARLQVAVEHRGADGLREDSERFALELARKRAEFDALAGRYDELVRARETLAQHLAVVSADLRRAEATIQELRAAEAGLQAQVKQCQADVAAHRAIAADRDRELRQRDQELRQRDQELRQRFEELRSAESRIAALLSSKSWRWTAPLRRIYELLDAARGDGGNSFRGTQT